MQRILARWYGVVPNWGDALNPWLVQKLCGIEPINVLHPDPVQWRLEQCLTQRPEPEHLVIGSILSWGSHRDDVTVIWGAGFMSAGQKLSGRPKEICAVRGPLSRDQIRYQGYACPDVFGDPALLMPQYYNPSIDKRYRLGIIPHFCERQHATVTSLAGNDDVLFIDILGDTLRVIDQILSCERIVSSSLHGLIASDAYGVPSLWVQITPQLAEQRFKYLDYFASVGRSEIQPFGLTPTTRLSELVQVIPDHQFDLNLEPLKRSCPFN